MRLAPLAPALSQMIVDLGAADRLVAVADNDMAAPPGLPVVGNYNEISTELLLAVRPTHVLMMTASAGVPRRLTSLAAAGRFTLLTYPYPRTIAEVADTLYTPASAPAPAPGSDGAQGLGPALGLADEARALRQRMFDQLEALRQLTAPLDRPSVLLVIGSTPLMASGPGTVHHELLAYVGGRNAAAAATVTAPTFDREALIALQPDVILLLMPESPPLQPGDPRLADFAGLPIPAVANARIILLNDPLVLLPATSLPRIAGQMAEAIHPEIAGEVERVLE